MNEIARAAGVSKGTLYVYFKSKEELFEAIVEEQCRQQGEQIFTFDRRGGHRERAEAASAAEFSRFMTRPGGVSELRTVIAIADRMPELGAKFYQSGPGTRHRQPEGISRGQGRGRRARAARLRGRGRPVHRRLRVDDLQADALQSCRAPPDDAAHRPRRRHGCRRIPRRLPQGLSDGHVTRPARRSAWPRPRARRGSAPAAPGTASVSASSMRSQISCEAATVMLPGTTRWNSMKVTRPAVRVLTSCASIAPSRVAGDDLPDMARDLGRHGLVHQAAHGLAHEAPARPQDVGADERGERGIEDLPAGRPAPASGRR